MNRDCENLRVPELVEESIEGWRSAGRELPKLRRRYSELEQQERECVADACLERVDRAMRDLRQRKLGPEEAQTQITAAAVELTKCALDLQDPYVDWLLGDGFGGVSTALARRARRMDPSVSLIDILQAARNAWTAAGLQALLGYPVQLTPSIFAYSMLYPYSDNYLDDARASREAKLAFSIRFRERLMGARPRPDSEREELIWDLVEMIETEYVRTGYPQVYQSLLAIHGAQEGSIRQLQRHNEKPGFDVLRLTFTKGGTSVLADACLAGGQLSLEQIRLAFHWGVVLQLGDDLQDVRSDRQRGSLTLYTQAAGREPLDEITNRTFQFGQWAMAPMDGLENGRPVLGELLRRSSQLLLIRSAASASKLYTAEYLHNLESYSPFRFEFLRRREQELHKTMKREARAFEDARGSAAAMTMLR